MQRINPNQLSIFDIVMEHPKEPFTPPPPVVELTAEKKEQIKNGTIYP